MSATTTVRERPILMSAPMVRAILDGKKTQTRRVVVEQPFMNPGGKYEPHDPFVHRDGVTWGWMSGVVTYTHNDRRCPFGAAGDRLYVRETWSADEDWMIRVFYRADDSCRHIGYHEHDEWHDGDASDLVYRPRKWRPSIFMPRDYSRLSLDISGIRVERLQSISEDDAKAEGIDTCVVDPSPRGISPIKPKNYVFARDCYQDLWDSLNAKRGYGWDVNPWVWVIEFQRVTP